MMDVHVVYTALMVFGCIVFRRVVYSEEDYPDIYVSCVEGFYRWKDKCYIFKDDFENTYAYDDVQRICWSINTRVAEPTTKPYNEHIKATGRRINKGYRYFIGLRKSSDGNWRWESINQPPKFTDWAPGQPKNGDCVYLQLKYEPEKWHDMPCSQFAFVICEYDADVDECKNGSLVCMNGGTCSDTEHFAASCSCPASTTGRVCETDLLDQCTSSPCGNAGTCSDLNFSYTCTCPPYWTGTNCETAISGPGKPDVRIVAPNLFQTDGFQSMTLFCNTTLDAQINRMQWSGMSCQGGNYATSCTFTPDPTLDTDKKVKCTIHDPNTGLNTTEVEYTLKFNWTGIARVKCLQLNTSDADIFTDKTNEPYDLDCLAIGKPKPALDVFLVTGATGSGSAAREVKQVKYRDLPIGLYRRQKVYTVRSPAVCQTFHTFRCYTNNSNGNHSKTITITAACVSSIEPTAFDMTLIASVLASSSVLCALLAATILFVRRWKSKRAMREMAEAESRRRSAMDLHDAGLTEPETSATPAGETASPLLPDTSANLEPEGNSPSNSSTDSSIDSAEINQL